MHCQGGKVFRTEMNSLAKPLYMQCHRVPSNIRSQIILSLKLERRMILFFAEGIDMFEPNLHDTLMLETSNLCAIEFPSILMYYGQMGTGKSTF